MCDKCNDTGRVPCEHAVADFECAVDVCVVTGKPGEIPADCLAPCSCAGDDNKASKVLSEQRALYPGHTCANCWHYERIVRGTGEHPPNCNTFLILPESSGCADWKHYADADEGGGGGIYDGIARADCDECHAIQAKAEAHDARQWECITKLIRDHTHGKPTGTIDAILNYDLDELEKALEVEHG